MQILVWKSKHADYYFDASTPEDLEKSARKILQKLVDGDWIFEPSLYESWDKELVEVSNEALEGLPSSMVEEVEQHRAKKARAISEFEAEKTEWNQLQKILAGEEVVREYTNSAGEVWKRPVTAWGLLQNRSGYEYEEYDVVKVETNA